jgi:hypothetical protein
MVYNNVWWATDIRLYNFPQPPAIILSRSATSSYKFDQANLVVGEQADERWMENDNGHSPPVSHDQVLQYGDLDGLLTTIWCNDDNRVSSELDSLRRD